MPFNFPDPQTTPEFTADNGITYVWDVDDSKWQVKTTAWLGEYAKTAYSDAEDKKLQNQIDRLKEQVDILNEINKGSVARYIIDNNTGGPVSRPGQISVSSGYWSSVSKFSFGTADADGTATPSMSNGDIIETYNAKENKTNRYAITNASGAPTVVEVQYISGGYFYMAGDELEVNIY